MKREIFGGELILKAFLKIKTLLRGRLIFLNSEPWAKIADDSDGHRTREGFMCYKRVAVVRVSGIAFLLVMGEKSGDYPAEKYDCDITAIRLGKKPVRTTKGFLIAAADMLERSEYFKNSLVLTMSWGDIAIGGDSCFKHIIEKKLPMIIDSIKASDAKFDREHLLLSSLMPITTRPAMYHLDSPKILAETLIEVLKESL